MTRTAGSSSSSASSSRASSSVPVHDDAAVEHVEHAGGDGLGGARVVAGEHHDLDARLAQRARGGRRAGAHRVGEADEPGEDRGRRRRRRRGCCRRRRRCRARRRHRPRLLGGEPARSAAASTRDALPREPARCARGGAGGLVVERSARPAVARAMTTSGAPLTDQPDRPRPPRVVGLAERRVVAAGRARSGARRSGHQPGCLRGRGDANCWPPQATARSVWCARRSPGGRARGGAQRGREHVRRGRLRRRSAGRSSTPSETPTSARRPSVRVPVLSKHSTSVRPSASMVRGLRTRAPSADSRRAGASWAADDEEREALGDAGDGQADRRSAGSRWNGRPRSRAREDHGTGRRDRQRGW